MESITDLIVQKINFCDCVIEKLEMDYRKITPNSLFFCISKEEFVDLNIPHPLTSYPQAIKKGAIVVVSNNKLALTIPKNVVWVKVLDEYLAMALIARKFFQNPFKSTKIIGITGTNGKTTTNQLLASVLTAFQQNTASVGTLGIQYANKNIDTALTTPPILELYQNLSAIGDLSYLVIEVTSHASNFQRTASLEFDLLIFTNLTSDHLDFHLSWENYKQSKLDYFYRLRQQKKSVITLINKDDAMCQEFCEIVIKSTRRKIYTYSVKNQNADFFAKILVMNNSSSHYSIFYRGDYLGTMRFQIAGLFNIYNSLATFCSCYLFGFPVEQIICHLEKITNISGRFEKISNNFGIHVFVDYAHTADSLEHVLTTIRQNIIEKQKKLITLFGCGGDRDKNKRPIMGKIAAKLSDFVVLTSDNPRTESEADILAAIQDGIPSQKQNTTFVIKDRKQAIYFALQMAKPSDLVLIAGKGCETYQIVGNKKNYFSDKKVVLDFFSDKKNA